MKVSCRYSGIEFRAEHFNMQVLGEHPLFLLETNRLLSLYRVWLNQINDKQEAIKLGETETKLLFVALLKSTELVKFQIPARPTFITATRHMPKLAEFVAFRQTIPNVEVAFPHIAITPDTDDCIAAGTWLDRWESCKQDWMDDYRQSYLNVKLQHLEDLLMRFIKSPEGNQARKVSRLCEWALVASDTPKEKWEYWTTLFKLRGLEIFQANTSHLEYLLEYMEDNLPHGSNFSFETLRHIREIYARNSKGLLFNLGGGEDGEDNDLDPFFTSDNPFKFIEDDVESINKRIAAQGAPLKEPSKIDYPNLVEYLQAKAKWLLASKEQIIRQAVEEREKRHMARAAKDNPGDEVNEDVDQSSEIEDIIKSGG